MARIAEVLPPPDPLTFSSLIVGTLRGPGQIEARRNVIRRLQDVAPLWAMCGSPRIAIPRRRITVGAKPLAIQVCGAAWRISELAALAHDGQGLPQGSIDLGKLFGRFLFGLGVLHLSAASHVPPFAVTVDDTLRFVGQAATCTPRTRR
jgi:hypothetical protein